MRHGGLRRRGGSPYDAAMPKAPSAVDSLLAIDIGNTRVGFAVWNADGLHDTQRVLSEDEDAVRAALRDSWQRIKPDARRAIAIGSVAPRMTQLVAEMCADECGSTPFVVRDTLPLPMELAIDNPDEVGVDRVCAAAAAYDKIRNACAIASFGTAITIDCVSAQGHFQGGAILPGLQMSFDALHEFTAVLPHVNVAAPADLPGRNTIDAMRAGVIYGAVGALRELVERYATDLGFWPRLIVTGGNANLIREAADFVDAWVPDLCLMGISLAYRQAAMQR